MTEFAEGPAEPRTLLADARTLLGKYDGLTMQERLAVGDVMLAEVQARALVSIADSLDFIACRIDAEGVHS